MPNFRPDRAATLYFFHPLRRMLGRTPAGIPILMYHSISENIGGRRSGYFDICTRPQAFRQQIEWLARNGYQTISLGEAAVKLKVGAGTDEKVVVLTFDDGYVDFYTEAFPTLDRFGYTATVFLPTAYIGDGSREFNGATCLTWDQVRELRKAGVDFGSHTVTHPQLTMLPPAEIRDELEASKQEIEERLGSPIESFSYPYAFPEPNRAFREELREMLIQAGYESGVSTMVGTATSASDRLFLERLPVNSSDDEAFFSAKLEGGYDWLHTLQLASKQRSEHATAEGGFTKRTQ